MTNILQQLATQSLIKAQILKNMNRIADAYVEYHTAAQILSDLGDPARLNTALCAVDKAIEIYNQMAIHNAELTKLRDTIIKQLKDPQ